MSLRVLDPGLHTLIVDFGRPHCRSLGLPVGGAADRTSLALGNALVGNPPDAAALEFSLSGPTLQADCELACVVFGAQFEVSTPKQKLRSGKTFTLQSGEVLEIAGTFEGMRGYLCVAGGIRTKLILGSRSSLEPVAKDEALPCRSGRIRNRFARIHWHWDQQKHESPIHRDAQRLRIIDGPQADWFPEEERGRAVSESDHNAVTTYTISRSSNRMGLRLEGRPLTFPARELLSEPVCPGTVQVTRDGQCIILGVDGQTIGGYPKIAHVISADLDVLGHLRPGEAVYFRKVTHEEAERIYEAKQREVRQWITRMQVSALS